MYLTYTVFSGTFKILNTWLDGIFKIVLSVVQYVQFPLKRGEDSTFGKSLKLYFN